MSWEEIEKGREYKLNDPSLSFECAIRKMSGSESWTVRSSLFGMLIVDADSPEEAMWRATVHVYDYCNRLANHYHRIRDHLPSLHELAREACI